MFAIFNNDKNFIGYTPDTVSMPGILRKEIPEHQRNLQTWQWRGDYDNGCMVDILQEGYSEEELVEEEQMYNIINKKYPPSAQLIYIIEQLKLIVNSPSIPENLKHDGFLDMSEIVLKAVAKRNNRLKYRSNKFKNLYGQRS